MFVTMPCYRFKKCIYCNIFMNVNNNDIHTHMKECIQIQIQKINKTFLNQEIKLKSILIQFYKM